WRFEGTLAQQYAQVGNAVPTRLGYVAGEVLLRELDQVACRAKLPKRPESDEPRIVYLQSHVRTRRWYKSGETILWNSGSRNTDAQYGKPRTLKKQRSL